MRLAVGVKVAAIAILLCGCDDDSDDTHYFTFQFIPRDVALAGTWHSYSGTYYYLPVERVHYQAQKGCGTYFIEFEGFAYALPDGAGTLVRDQSVQDSTSRMAYFPMPQFGMYPPCTEIGASVSGGFQFNGVHYRIDGCINSGFLNYSSLSAPSGACEGYHESDTYIGCWPEWSLEGETNSSQYRFWPYRYQPPENSDTCWGGF